MDGWKTDKLGCLCTMYQPQTISTNQLNEHGRYLVYGANGIIGRYDKYNHEKSQLLMTCRGNTCGEITVSKPFSWINGNAMVISPCDNKIVIKYLEYYLKHINLEHIITGGAQPQITRTALRLLKISYPESHDEQTAIAAILSKVDEAIASVQASIAAAERLKKSLMQNLLTGRMKPDGTLRKEDEFYLDEKFGRVPLGWHWGRLSEIAEIIAGQSPQGEYYNEDGLGCPMLNGPTEFTDKYPIPVQWTTKVTKLCQKGDILFTVRGSSTGRMNFADQEYCIGRGLAAIRPKPNSNIQFIYYTLLKISEMILAEAKGAGTTFPNVSRGDLMKKEILIPDNQEEIVKQICLTEHTIILKQNKIAVLERLKKSLMQNLLTGKVRVK